MSLVNAASRASVCRPSDLADRTVVQDEAAHAEANMRLGSMQVAMRMERASNPVVVAVILALTILTAEPAGAADSRGRYARALTEIPVEEQVELAMSAAPPHISHKATIYVLGTNGYVQARTGTNGFSCLVERQYLETLEPSCYDAEGSATTLRARLYREELRAAKIAEDQIERRINDRYKMGTFTAPRKPGLVYMLSPHNRVHNDRTNKIINVPPHLMFYAPYATQKNFGEFVGPHMPYVVLEGQPDAYIIVSPEAMASALQRQRSAADRTPKD
jgi:hypothetical protein